MQSPGTHCFTFIFLFFRRKGLFLTLTEPLQPLPVLNWQILFCSERPDSHTKELNSIFAYHQEGAGINSQIERQENGETSLHVRSSHRSTGLFAGCNHLRCRKWNSYRKLVQGLHQSTPFAPIASDWIQLLSPTWIQG